MYSAKSPQRISQQNAVTGLLKRNGQRSDDQIASNSQSGGIGLLRANEMGEDIMHEEHWQAAEEHERAARAHRTAAEHNEKGESESGNWHAERALEYSDQAYKLAKKAHNKSGQIEEL